VIAIIDYGAGNLRSIQRALESTGAETIITSDPDALRDADAVVLPGVGNAGHAINRLESLGFTRAIHESVDAGKPFLGICVGMQVLFDDQEEGDTTGLGLLRGRVRSIQGAAKLPHIGWNQSVPTPGGKLPASEPSYYYFVHSYVAEPDNPADIAATAVYGESFPSVVIRDNVWGTQFHPEKSGSDGLELIGHWVAEVRQQTPRRS
jgi:imidazole glycerol-phosphate synthase subunit HisH